MQKHKMDTDTDLLILYGSQTGNAQVPSKRHQREMVAASTTCVHVQDVAERIRREAKLLLFRPQISPFDGFDISSLPSCPAVIFVLSTAGQVPNAPGGMLGPSCLRRCTLRSYTPATIVLVF